MVSFGVRHGCFCAQPYVGPCWELPRLKEGIKPISPARSGSAWDFAIPKEEIDQLIDALERISRKEYREEYQLDEKLGEYLAQDFPFNYQKYSDF